jgi:hypothetical protein
VTGDPLALLRARLAQADVALLPDWQAAEVLNTPDPANGLRPVDVPAGAAWLVLFKRRALSRVLELAERPLTGDPAHDAGILEAKGLALLLGSGAGQFTMTDPGVAAAVADSLSKMAAAGALTADDIAAIQAISMAPQSWAKAAGMTVDADLISLARKTV